MSARDKDIDFSVKMFAGITPQEVTVISPSRGVILTYAESTSIKEVQFYAKSYVSTRVYGSYMEGFFASTFFLAMQELSENQIETATLLSSFPEEEFPVVCAIKKGKIQGKLLPNLYGLFNEDYCAEIADENVDGLCIVSQDDDGTLYVDKSRAEESMRLLNSSLSVESMRDAIATYYSGYKENIDFEAYVVNNNSFDILVLHQVGTYKGWFAWVYPCLYSLSEEEIAVIKNATLLFPSLSLYLK